MNSKLLNEKGLKHIIAGSEYNFRSKTLSERELKENYSRLVEAVGNGSGLGLEFGPVYSATQVHGDRIAYVDGSQGEDFVVGKTIPDTDGLITDQVGLPLIIKYADCTPIVLYDPVKKVQASVHSGWRGTVQRIGIKAAQKMVDNFGSDLADLVVYLGPSIDASNYEVGPEVYEAFEKIGSREAYFTPHGEKYLLSNIDAIYHDLLAYGFLAEQIEVAPESTFTDARLHSARGEGSQYGLNAIITVME